MPKIKANQLKSSQKVKSTSFILDPAFEQCLELLKVLGGFSSRSAVLRVALGQYAKNLAEKDPTLHLILQQKVGLEALDDLAKGVPRSRNDQNDQAA